MFTYFSYSNTKTVIQNNSLTGIQKKDDRKKNSTSIQSSNFGSTAENFLVFKNSMITFITHWSSWESTDVVVH